MMMSSLTQWFDQKQAESTQLGHILVDWIRLNYIHTYGNGWAPTIYVHTIHMFVSSTMLIMYDRIKTPATWVGPKSLKLRPAQQWTTGRGSMAAYNAYLFLIYFIILFIYYFLLLFFNIQVTMSTSSPTCESLAYCHDIFILN